MQRQFCAPHKFSTLMIPDVAIKNKQMLKYTNFMMIVQAKYVKIYFSWFKMSNLLYN